MSIYVNLLNESSVTFVRDLGAYGWGALAGMPGFEAISPTGEIQAFTDQKAAESWRRREVAFCADYDERTVAAKAARQADHDKTVAMIEAARSERVSA